MLYLVTELGDYNHTRRWSDTQANILFPQLFNLLLVQVTSFRLNAYFGYKTLISFISFIFLRMGGTDILSVTGSRCIQRPDELSQVICTWWLWRTRDNITSIRPSSWISNLSLSLLGVQQNNVNISNYTQLTSIETRVSTHNRGSFFQTFSCVSMKLLKCTVSVSELWSYI